MPSGRRCSLCNLNWPITAAGIGRTPYDTCARCGEKTSYMVDLEEVMTKEQADYKVKELAFEDYYKKRAEREYDPMLDPDKKRSESHVRAIAKAEAQQETMLRLRSIPTLDEESDNGGSK